MYTTTRHNCVSRGRGRQPAEADRREISNDKSDVFGAGVFDEEVGPLHHKFVDNRVEKFAREGQRLDAGYAFLHVKGLVSQKA